MKIVTWNCKGAYRKKHNKLVAEYDPDIWVIQECENPDRLNKSKEFNHSGSLQWFGDNPNRGVGIFSKPGISLEIDSFHSDAYRYVIPVTVCTSKRLRLLVVWAMNDKIDRKKRYIGQVYKALCHYSDKIDESTFVLGDFNWNVSFKQSGELYGNLEDVITLLASKGIVSCYHILRKENFGNETIPTLYFRGQQNSQFHIDYIFAHNEKIAKGIIDIGEWEPWWHFSDHVPIMLNLSS